MQDAAEAADVGRDLMRSRTWHFHCEECFSADIPSSEGSEGEKETSVLIRR